MVALVYIGIDGGEAFAPFFSVTLRADGGPVRHVGYWRVDHYLSHVLETKVRDNPLAINSCGSPPS